MRKKIVLALVCVMVAVGMVACGGGGGSDSSSAAVWSGPVNADGFPDVVGTYAFTTSAISYSCTDGSKDTYPALSFNATLSQSQNAIAATSNNPLPAGFTITYDTGLSGTVDKSGNFAMIKSATATVNGIPGEVTLTYNITGTFTPSSWSGQYTYSMFFQAYNGTCTGKSTFSGDKI